MLTVVIWIVGITLICGVFGAFTEKPGEMFATERLRGKAWEEGRIEARREFGTRANTEPGAPGLL